MIDKLTRWYELSQQLSEIKKEELRLRQEIFAEAFPSPTEGTNLFDLPDGYALKATLPINRSIEKEALEELFEEFTEKGLPINELVKYKASLAVSAYRELTAEEQHLFDQCMVIKPGTPSFEIKKVKKK